MSTALIAVAIAPMVPVVPAAASNPKFTVARVDVPAHATPIVGRFNDDAWSDVLWYSPGRSFDQLMLTGPGGKLQRASVRIDGYYEPLVGDFNGDRFDDILWYAAGPRPDYLWLSNHHGKFISSALTIDGVFQPVVGYFGGGHGSDILWYGRGSAPDYIAYASWSGAFSVHPVTISGSYDAIVPCWFTGSTTDLLFWSSSTTRHPVWLPRAHGGFTSITRSSPAIGAYPIVMNITDSGQGRGADILWYGRGTIPDALALSGKRAFIPETIDGDYQPLTGYFEPRVGGGEDIVWWARAHDGVDRYWHDTGGHGIGDFGHDVFVSGALGAPHVDQSTHQAIVGHFNGDNAAADIWFYDPTGRDTFIYFGTGT